MSATYSRSFNLRHSTADPTKPNVIFSSNIPPLLAQCVSEHHLFLGGSSPRFIDLAPLLPPLEIVLDLNTLLLRNPPLASYLPYWLSQNAIFVAKSKLHRHYRLPLIHNHKQSISSILAANWNPSILDLSNPSEVFVVTIVVCLARLVIDLSTVSEVSVSFIHDKVFDSVLLRDPELISLIETYIKNKLILEVKQNSASITHDIANSSTILQESPVNESLALMEKLRRDLQQNDGEDANDDEISNLISNISMECSLSPPPCPPSKLLPHQDSPDFPVSDEELRLLSSDDSGKCTANDDDDDEDEQNQTHHAQESVSMAIPDQGNSGLQEPYSLDLHMITSSFPSLLSPAKRPTESFPPPRMATSPLKMGTSSTPTKPAPPTTPSRKSPSKSPANSNITLSPTRTELRQPLTPENASLLLHKSLEFEDRPVTAPEFGSPQQVLGSPMRPSVTQSASVPSLRKKDSFSYYSLVSDDASPELEYAFRDKSPTVPSYIKGDRKFKFIKVGKVQKFVNLFEEKVDKELASSSNPGSRVLSRQPSRQPSRLGSRSTSRKPTRPGSPTRKHTSTIV